MSDTWVERWIVAYYGDDSRGVPVAVLAPCLCSAFNLARSQHPTATRWECLGTVGPDEVVS